MLQNSENSSTPVIWSRTHAAIFKTLKNVIDPAAHLSSGIKKPCTNIAKGAGISMIKIYPRIEPATVFLTRSAIITVSFKDHAPHQHSK